MLIDAKVIRLLEGANFASLATVSPIGSPQVSAVWVDVDSDYNILINTAIGRQKERNAQINSRVALSVINKSNPYETATISGTVIDRNTKDALTHFDRLSEKYLNLKNYPLAQARSKRIILKICPLKVTYLLIPI